MVSNPSLVGTKRVIVMTSPRTDYLYPTSVKTYRERKFEHFLWMPENLQIFGFNCYIRYSLLQLFQEHLLRIHIHPSKVKLAAFLQLVNDLFSLNFSTLHNIVP